MPFSPLHLLALLFLISFLFALVQVGLLSIAFEKLGLPPNMGITFLITSLFGSLVNIPITSIDSHPPEQQATPWLWQGMLRHTRPFTGKTLIGINVGGCVLPLILCLHLLGQHDLALVKVLLAIALVSALSFSISRPIPGIGIGMPVFVAPLCAALVALILDPAHSAPLAYISGTLGVLIGADLLRIRDVGMLGTPTAAIGGAGTFDGIFITGIVAALLA